MYHIGIAYFLWLISGFGALGLHRLYLRKFPTALLWLCTGGLGMFGAVYDFLTLPDQVREANIRNALFDRRPKHPAGRQENWRYASDAQYTVVNEKKHEKESPERTILKLAKENKGILTVSEVALGANIPIEEAKKLLETLASKGFAELRVRKSGSLVYVIPDMADEDEPLEDF